MADARHPHPDEDTTFVSGDTDDTVDSTDLDATLASGDADATLASGDVASTPSPPPKRIGRYDIQEELGRGGMGVVYVARDPRLGRDVALKVLPDALARDAETFRLFESEAKLLAALHHPNVATIHSLEEADGVHFLTMELIPGQPLSDRLSVPLSVGDVHHFGRQIAAALEAAHRVGVVHRDLKPDNVMVLPDGQVKVLDFGLALALGARTDDAGQVRTGALAPEVIAGTPGYMSPEQIRRAPVDHRADVWAFGCILYEALAGKRAFTGGDLRARLDATLSATPDWSAFPVGVTEPMRMLVEACLTRDVAERLDSITTARHVLEDEIAQRALPSLEARRPDDVPNNLPVAETAIVGREAERTRVTELLDANRLVTLTGIGGGGKTTLALAVGRDRLSDVSDGVWIVALAPLSDEALIPQAVATALGVRDQPGRGISDTLLDHLRDRAPLVLLDNCEHVIDAASAFVHTMLRECPSVRVIATSREPLGVAGEVLVHVPPLTVPDADAATPLDTLADVASVRLFITRATEANDSFTFDARSAAAVADICRRVDGIPLAIELAAAQVRRMAPEAIAEDIASQLDVSARAEPDDRIAHHHTLRAMIDWSYERLEEVDRSLLRRLAMFRGGWSLDAAEVVCAGADLEEFEVMDSLSALVDKSLIDPDREGGRRSGRARYAVLQPVRAYAEEKLAGSDELAAVRTRHLDYFVSLAERGDEALTGPTQAEWIERLDVDVNNLRHAFDSALTDAAAPDDRFRLAGSLGRFWLVRGLWSEGRARYEQILTTARAMDTGRDARSAEAVVPSRAHAKCLNWAGNLTKLQGDAPAATRFLEAAVDMARSLGEQRTVAASLNTLAHIARDSGDLSRARTLYEESLAIQRALANDVGISASLDAIGVVAHLQGDHEAALRHHEESLDIGRRAGDRAGIATTSMYVANVAEVLGDYDRAQAFLSESLAIQRELGDRWGMAGTQVSLGRLAQRRNQLVVAEERYEEALDLFRTLGDKRNVATALANLGTVAEKQGEIERARELYADSLGMFGDLGDRPAIANLLLIFGQLASDVGDPERAVRLMGAAEARREEAGTTLPPNTRDSLEQRAESLRERLGDAARDAAWHAGRTLSQEAAIRFALERDPSGSAADADAGDGCRPTDPGDRSPNDDAGGRR